MPRSGFNPDLIGAKNKFDGGSYDFKESIKKFELGLPVGIAYQINSGVMRSWRSNESLTKTEAGTRFDRVESNQIQPYLIQGVSNRFYTNLIANSLSNKL